MANLAQALKDEIVRLARKEIKMQVGVTKRAATRHRGEIAELKRRIGSLEKKVAFLEREEKKRVVAGPSESAATKTRFSAQGLKTHRAKVGLSAKNYGRLVGVGHLSIYDWERGKSRPRPQRMAALAEVRKLGKREAERRLEMLP